MPAIVPSYVAKVTRAKKHLIDLEAAIDKYALRNPYAVRERIEGKKKRKSRRIVFTEDPANTDIPIIAADVIYNLRSSLDHLMASLVPNARRSSVMFPVFWHGVWDQPVEGENEQRLKDRDRWATCVKGLPGPALAFLKAAQPPDGGRYDEANLIEVLNRLSNRDRHDKLPVAVAGMRNFMVRWVTREGKAEAGLGSPGTDSMFQDDTEIKGIPYHAMNVQIAGAPLIAIHLAAEDRHIEIPKQLADTARLIERRVIPALAPYDRRRVGK